MTFNRRKLALGWGSVSCVNNRSSKNTSWQQQFRYVPADSLETHRRNSSLCIFCWISPCSRKYVRTVSIQSHEQLSNDLLLTLQPRPEAQLHRLLHLFLIVFVASAERGPERRAGAPGHATRPERPSSHLPQGLQPASACRGAVFVAVRRPRRGVLPGAAALRSAGA